MDLSKAIQLNSTDATLYSARASIYYQKNDFDKAISDYTEAIRFNPKCTDAYIYRGCEFMMKSDYDKAIKDSCDAIDLDPKSSMAFFVRGSSYLGKNDLNKAITDLSESIRLNPTYAAAYYVRGWAYKQKADHDKVSKKSADYIKNFDIQFDELNQKRENIPVYKFGSFDCPQKTEGEKNLNEINQPVQLNIYPGKKEAKVVEEYYESSANIDIIRAENDFVKAKELGYKPGETGKGELGKIENGGMKLK